MGVEENEGDPVFFLTPDVQSHECWKFSSSNLKHKTRLYQRLNKEVLKYRVNYMVYYGTHHLSDEIEFDLNEKDYDQAIYPELVRAFNPMPETIACKCPDLVVNVEWGSYYIEKDFQLDDYERESII